MNAMIDARCSKCRAHIGWYGTMASMPVCSKCGHRPPQAELDAVAARMEEQRQRLATSPLRASADMKRQQRVDAGLTLRQAAKLLGVPAVYLASVERGDVAPTPEECQKMAEVYDIIKE